MLIPARNAEALLPRCLRSVQRARRAVRHQVTTDLVVVADSSTDRTEQIAREMIGTSGCLVRTTAGVVGSARALAARLAICRYHGPLETCWLANTDADCVVPEDWLSLQLSLAQRGHSAVAGIVDVDSYEEHMPMVQQMFCRSYLLHSDGIHPHVHGANLGVRADAYLRAGGWAHKATAEDHDLWQRLQRAGERRLFDVRLKVLTSGRRVGRAPLGFAAALAAHNQGKR
ncbi:MAG: glycosyltransferase [Janthinobacterium lividum]